MKSIAKGAVEPAFDFNAPLPAPSNTPLPIPGSSSKAPDRAVEPLKNKTTSIISTATPQNVSLPSPLSNVVIKEEIELAPSVFDFNAPLLIPGSIAGDLDHVGEPLFDFNALLPIPSNAPLPGPVSEAENLDRIAESLFDFNPQLTLPICSIKDSDLAAKHTEPIFDFNLPPPVHGCGVEDPMSMLNLGDVLQNMAMNEGGHGISGDDSTSFKSSGMSEHDHSSSLVENPFASGICPFPTGDVDIVMTAAQTVGHQNVISVDSKLVGSSEMMVIDDGEENMMALDVPKVPGVLETPPWMANILRSVPSLGAAKSLKRITVEVDKIHFSFE